MTGDDQALYLYVSSKHLTHSSSMVHERLVIWDYATILFHHSRLGRFSRPPPIRVEDWLMMDGIEP